MMAVRAANGCAMFRSAASPPLSVFRCRLVRFRTPPGLRFSLSRSDLERRMLVLNRGGCMRMCSVHSLVDSVLEEIEASRKRRKQRLVCAASKAGLTSSGELLEEKLENEVLKQGSLLEFKKDSERILLGVAQRPDGKKNWMVSDQNGVSSSIKPQQVTFIVPGVENFDHNDISDFIQKAAENSDPSLLELAWCELLEENKSVTVPELAEMIFASAEPVDCYSAHLLLSKDEVYFAVQTTNRSRSIYVPRPVAQVEELTRRKCAKEAAEKELQEFLQLLKSAKAMPSNAKPSKSSWLAEEKNRFRIESLEAYAIDGYQTDQQKKTAETVLKELGRAKASASALNLLIDIGYFPVHVNIELLKLNIRTDHSEEIILAAENLLSESSDPDQIDRKDLTDLKVYAVDVDDADELDDALSATRLPDGRIKVWIHVADPARYVEPGSVVDKEAMARGTSIFLPTATYPMFPEKLAMEGMSLKQGEICNAVTVSVVLNPDGSIAEYSVDNSIIKPTYMLTYESASQLIYMNLEEEVELKILSEAAGLRLNWRKEQGAIYTPGIDVRIKVTNPDDPEPSISLYVENQADPAMKLVSEMMILCGEVIATFGSAHDIPLPYRGQPRTDIDISSFAHLPEGPVRNASLFKMMRGAEMDYRKPIPHGSLGLPGYVQFTSPIRRYMDLLAHYQVKAFLRGDSLPFTTGQLTGIASIVNMQSRLIKKISNNGLRYWMLEYLRRQPYGKTFRALILRFIKDSFAAVFLVEVGFQDTAWVAVGAEVGDEIDLQVEVAHPRSDILTLRQAM